MWRKIIIKEDRECCWGDFVIFNCSKQRRLLSDSTVWQRHKGGRRVSHGNNRKENSRQREEHTQRPWG